MSWYDTVFKSGLYDRFTFHIFTERTNLREVDFLKSALQLYKQNKVLDIACGHGRHALLLAQDGIDVTGVDITERYIEIANENNRFNNARFVVGDLREMNFSEEFDAAFNIFTSFGYYDDATNFDILRRIASSLKDGGRFLLDLQNRELFTATDLDYQEYTEFKQNGRHYALLMQCKFDLETGRAHIRQRLYSPDSPPETMEFSVRIYSLAELRWLLSQVGLELIKSYGNTDGSEYSASSPRCIVVAQKL
jgi:SAM-dependent methyltransferase